MMLEVLLYLGRVILKLLLIPWMLWLYKELTMGICYLTKKLDGKIVIITGGTKGIGFQTALGLAQRGAEVVVASHNAKETEAAVADLKEISGNPRIHARNLDLASQVSVRKFARTILEEFEAIHCLINNAGIGGDLLHKYLPNPDHGNPHKFTDDGYERIMATNFYGPLTLTELLFERVKASGKPGDPSRIIHISSLENYYAKINLFNLDLNSRKTPFDARAQYSNSKLLQLYYNQFLARKLKESNCQSVALHPGLVRTNFTKEFSVLGQWITYIKFLIVGKSAQQGAQTSIFAALSDEDLNGRYLSDCRDAWIVNPTVGREERETKIIKETKHLLGVP
ncbi:retinol dehydrogenase 11-like [Tigriopus californicus]|nr:retinol dehydrogenase 11-like [Tigriopus californicus]